MLRQQNTLPSPPFERWIYYGKILVYGGMIYSTVQFYLLLHMVPLCGAAISIPVFLLYNTGHADILCALDMGIWDSHLLILNNSKVLLYN